MEWAAAGCTTKIFTDQVLQWVRGQGKILIVVHDNPDPDCLASAMALRHLFVVKLNRDATIAFSGMIGRSENIAMAKELEIPLTPMGVLNLREFQVICMLDTQPGTGNNSLPAGVKVDLLIDHHPLKESSKSCRWIDVREDYGVTATIVYEYLHAQEVGISTKLASAIFYAIKSETQDLGREAAKPDREAYLRLFPRANKKLLYEITHPKLPIEYFLTMGRALENTKIYKHVVITNLSHVSFPEIVAEMADLLLRLEGIDIVLCMGHYATEMLLSVRTSRQDLNAGSLIRRLVVGRGLAGGHGMMAGGKINGVGSSPDARGEVETLLTMRILEELSLTGVPPVFLHNSGHQ